MVIPVTLIGKLYDQVARTVKTSGEKDQQNIILFVGVLYGHMIDAMKAYQKDKKKKFRLALLHDSREKLDQYTEKAMEKINLVLSCDTKSHTAIQETLMPYQNELLAVTSRSEKHVPVLSRILPNVPYVNAPTTESLHWASDKIAMRERLKNYNPAIAPSFAVIHDNNKESLDKVERDVQFPLIVKPSGLASSALVNICYHREELEDVLKKVFRKIKTIYKQKNFTGEPQVLIEQFMEGEMYSVDAYVNAQGKIFFCPPVYIKTGKRIGFDDFFGYYQVTPTLLNNDSIREANLAATQAIYALGLRNTTAHVELLKTEEGWKIIEAGARIGGFRHMMYEFSYGINHTANDVAIRLQEKPVIPKSVKGYTAAMKFYAKSEGKLKSIVGVKKAQELKSFKRMYVNKKVGESCKYAKHGGNSVFNIILHNKDRSDLLADVRRLEQMIRIETE